MEIFEIGTLFYDSYEIPAGILLNDIEGLEYLEMNVFSLASQLSAICNLISVCYSVGTFDLLQLQRLQARARRSAFAKMLVLCLYAACAVSCALQLSSLLDEFLSTELVTNFRVEEEKLFDRFSLLVCFHLNDVQRSANAGSKTGFWTAEQIADSTWNASELIEDVQLNNRLLDKEMLLRESETFLVYSQFLWLVQFFLFLS